MGDFDLPDLSADLKTQGVPADVKPVEPSKPQELQEANFAIPDISADLKSPEERKKKKEEPAAGGFDEIPEVAAAKTAVEQAEIPKKSVSEIAKTGLDIAKTAVSPFIDAAKGVDYKSAGSETQKAAEEVKKDWGIAQQQAPAKVEDKSEMTIPDITADFAKEPEAYDPFAVASEQIRKVGPNAFGDPEKEVIKTLGPNQLYDVWQQQPWVWSKLDKPQQDAIWNEYQSKNAVTPETAQKAGESFAKSIGGALRAGLDLSLHTLESGIVEPIDFFTGKDKYDPNSRTQKNQEQLRKDLTNLTSGLAGTIIQTKRLIEKAGGDPSVVTPIADNYANQMIADGKQPDSNAYGSIAGLETAMKSMPYFSVVTKLAEMAQDPNSGSIAVLDKLNRWMGLTDESLERKHFDRRAAYDAEKAESDWRAAGGQPQASPWAQALVSAPSQWIIHQYSRAMLPTAKAYAAAKNISEDEAERILDDQAEKNTQARIDAYAKKLSKDYDPDMEFLGSFALGEATMGPAGLALGATRLGKMGLSAAETFGMTKEELAAYQASQAVRNLQRTKDAADRAAKAGLIGRTAGAIEQVQKAIPQKFREWGESLPPEVQALAPYAGKALEKIALGGAGAEIGAAFDPENPIRGALTGLTLGQIAGASPALIRSVSDASRYMQGGFGLGRGGLYETAGKLETSSPLTRALFGGGRGMAVDYVAKNALPIMRSGASLGALNVATSTLNSDDATKMVESGAEGFAMGGAFGLLHGGVGLVGGRNADEIMRDRKKQDIENYLSMQRADPKTREMLAQIGDYNERVSYWQGQLNKTQAELADAINSGDESKIAEAEKKVKVTQALFDQINKANIQTRSEYGRSIVSLFSDLNRLANGARGAGQGRVKIRILDQAEIWKMLHERNAKEGTGLTDEQVLQNSFAAGFFDKTTNEAIINGSRIKDRMARGESAHDALVHEGGGHVLFSIPEFREKNRKVEELLFGKKEVDLQGRILSKEDGQFSDEDLVKMYENYNKDLTPEEIEAQARQTGLWNEQTQSLDTQRVAEYMKEEVIAELVAGNLKNGLLNLKRTTGSLDRWITGRYKQSILARAMHDMLGRGVKPFESTLLGTRDTPLAFSEEAISANRDAISALEEFNGRFEDIPDGERGKDMSEKELRINPVARKRYALNGGEYKTQLVGVIKDAEGKVVAKVPIANPSAAEGSWKYDEAGNKTQTRGYGQVPDEFAGQMPPAGGTLEVVRDFVYEPDGKTPVRNTDKELADIEKSRGDLIREALESADDFDSTNRLRPFSVDGLSWSGIMSPKQIQNIKNIPESILPLSIKEKIFQFNDALALNDGSTFDIDYAARLGKSRKYKGRRSEIYHIIPVGFGFSKEGNFYLRTISLNALFRKVRARKERMKGWFDPWGGDTELFMKELQEKYLPNTKEGRAGWTGLDPDRPTEKTPLAETKMNRFNDMLNLMKSGVERINPEAMATPKKKGARKAEDVDTLWRSHRLDAIADIADTTEVTGTYPVGWERVYRNMMPAGRAEETVPRVEEERKPQALDLGITAAHSAQSMPFGAQYVAPQSQAAPKSDLFFMPASAEIREKGSKQHLEFWNRELENSGIKAKPATMDALDQFIHQYVKKKYGGEWSASGEYGEDAPADLFPQVNPEKIKNYYQKVVRGATAEQALNFPENWRRVRNMSDQEFNNFFSQDRVNEITKSRVETLAKSADYLLGEMQKPRAKSEIKEQLNFNKDLLSKLQKTQQEYKLENKKDEYLDRQIERQEGLIQHLENEYSGVIGEGYTPAEVAAILDASAKIRVRTAQDENGNLVPVKQKITNGNEVVPNEVSGATASRIAEYMRQGMGSEDAYVHGLFDTMKARAEQRGTYTGWKKYDQSDDMGEAEKLNADVAGTNWCTGGAVSTAHQHLRGGDFYVYFDEGEPQVAIRTEDGQIAEVRGRGEGQNITTPKYDQAAEDFIRSGEGPQGGNEYLHDREFRKMAVQIMQTGEVPEEALKYYNQGGMFSEVKPKMSYKREFEPEYVEAFKTAAIPASKIFDRKTGTLNTSLDYASGDPENSKYKQVKGNIYLSNYIVDNKLELPSLEKCGDIVPKTDQKKLVSVKLPKLQEAGNIDVRRLSTSLQLPKLKKAGEIYAHSATFVELPKLEKSGDIIAQSAKALNVPKLKEAKNIDYNSVDGTEYNFDSLEKVQNMWTRGISALEMPKLKEAGLIYNGYLTRGYFPELKNVLHLDSATIIYAPKLETASKINIQHRNELISNEVGFRAAMYAVPSGILRMTDIDTGKRYVFPAGKRGEFVEMLNETDPIKKAQIESDLLQKPALEPWQIRPDEKIVAATYGEPSLKGLSPEADNIRTGKTHLEADPTASENRTERETDEYGFLIRDSKGTENVVSRREAYQIAKIAGQLKDPETLDQKVDNIRGVLHSDMVNFMPKSAEEEQPEQKISSAGTSLRQVPAVFKAVPWKKGTLNADIGGGKYDEFTKALQGVGVENVIYDPYNRTPEHNDAAMARIAGNADTATISNVLNVIAEPAARDNVIRQAADAIKPDGEAYFSVYVGDGSGKGKETPRGYQLNRKLSDYIDEIEKHFGSVTKKGNILIATEPKKSDISFMPSEEEKKTLTAVHNLSEENLRNVLKVGGLAVPSVAVIRNDRSDFTSFGEITLVAPYSMVDPKRDSKAKVFNADVYSPRYPRVDYFMPDKKANRNLLASIKESLDKMPADLRKRFFASIETEQADRPMRERFLEDPIFMAAFLADTGRIKDVEFSIPEDERYADQSARWNVREFMRSNPDLKEEFNSWIESKLDDAGVAEEEKIFAGYTPSGSRRYVPHTLDNVVKMMAKSIRDGEGPNYGVGSVRSKAAKQFRTLEQVKNAREQIVSKDRMEELKAEVNDEFEQLAQESIKLRKVQRDFYFDQIADDMKALAEGGSENMNYLKEQYPNGAPFEKWRDYLDKLRNLPTEYFEAKIQRGVDLNEFAGAVVPKETSQDVIDSLEKRGLEVIKYDERNEGSRAQAIRDIGAKRSDISFMPSTKLDEAHAKAIESGDMEEAQRLVDEAGLSVARSLPKIESGDVVDGLVVRDRIPNLSSISASLENYEEIGLVAFPMSLLSTGNGGKEQKLADEINQSGELNPLIVVMSGHKSGPAYILEGSHRIDALAILGKKEFPALLLYDYGETDPATYDDQGNLIPLSQRFDTSKQDIRFMPKSEEEDRPMLVDEAIDKYAKSNGLRVVEASRFGKASEHFKTGEPVLLKMFHATRTPITLEKSGKFDPYKLGSTHGAPNDRLGWYFSSDGMIGDDGEYVGSKGDVLPFAITMKNPLVVGSDFHFVESKEGTDKLEKMLDEGKHDGIIAMIGSKLSKQQRPKVAKVYDDVIDNLSKELRNLTRKQQIIIEKQDSALNDWMSGRSEPIAGSDFLSKNPEYWQFLDKHAPDLVTAISSEFRGSSQDQERATNWWAIVPKEFADKNIKLRTGSTQWKGKQVPMSERFNPEKPNFNFMPKTEQEKGIDWNGLKFAADAFAKAPEKPLAGLALPTKQMPDIAFAPKQKQDQETGVKDILMKPTADGRTIVYQHDPKTSIKPPVKSLKKMIGEIVGMLEADRHNTLGTNMGGPMHPFLLSNQVIARLKDGRGFKPVWANMNTAFVTRAKNIIKNTTSGRALIQLMKEETHISNRKFVQDVMSELDKKKANMPKEIVDSLHVILELGARDPAKKLKEVTAAYKAFKKGEINQRQLNKVLKDNKEAIDKYMPMVQFIAKLSPIKSKATRGNIESFNRDYLAHIKSFNKQAWYKTIAEKYKNTSFTDEAARFTFNQRGAAMKRLRGIAHAPDIGKMLADSMDFKNGQNLDLVASVQLSKDPEAFAIYTGKDPKQEAKMSEKERYLRDQFMKNPEFRKHPSYDWMMLGPENADNFILDTPVDPLVLFPNYAKNHPKASVRNGSKETIVGTMKKSKIPLKIE